MQVLFIFYVQFLNKCTNLIRMFLNFVQLFDRQKDFIVKILQLFFQFS